MPTAAQAKMKARIRRARSTADAPPAYEHQREGFLIVRAFAGAAEYNGEKDFAISRASLADRLSITPPGAADVIRKLCELKVIALTQPYIRHKKPARFCWLLARPKNTEIAA